MKNIKNNDLIPQPSSVRELLQKILRYANTEIARKAFDEFIFPQHKYIAAICASTAKPHQRYTGNHITEELQNQLLVEIYRDPKRLLLAVKGLKNATKFNNYLQLEITLMGEEVLKEVIIKKEKAYRKLISSINSSKNQKLISNQLQVEEYELEAEEDSVEENPLDSTNSRHKMSKQQAVYDPDEELLENENEKEFIEEALNSMKERDRLILIEIIPFLEKGKQLPPEVRKSIREQHQISNAYLSRLIDRIKKRFRKTLIAIKQVNGKVL